MTTPSRFKLRFNCRWITIISTRAWVNMNPWQLTTLPSNLQLLHFKMYLLKVVSNKVKTVSRSYINYKVVPWLFKNIKGYLCGFCAVKLNTLVITRAQSAAGQITLTSKLLITVFSGEWISWKTKTLKAADHWRKIILKHLITKPKHAYRP